MDNENKGKRSRGATVLTEAETRGADEEGANRDPISGEPGSHPVGTGVGAAAGAAAGAVVGGAGGPFGAMVGGAVGAIVGGLAGHGVAEQVNPTVEDAYWRENYKNRDYVRRDRAYEEYQPAYRYGWESRSKYAGRQWDDKLERDLERGWDNAKGTSGMAWHEAKSATRDAWNRIGAPVPVLAMASAVPVASPRAVTTPDLSPADSLGPQAPPLSLVFDPVEDFSRLIESMMPQAVPTPSLVLQAHRNSVARAALIKEFGLLTSGQIAELNASAAGNRAALASRWKGEGKVFSVMHQGAIYYPGFQFDLGGRPRLSLARVLQALGGDHGWETALWFTTANGYLGGARPVDLLQADPEAVVEAARSDIEVPY